MVKYTGRGLVVKWPGVPSKVQMLNLVLGVGVFSLFPMIFVYFSVFLSYFGFGRGFWGAFWGSEGFYILYRAEEILESRRSFPAISCCRTPRPQKSFRRV